MGRFLIPGIEQAGDRLYFRRRWRDAEGKRHSQRTRLPALDSPDFADALKHAQGDEAAVPVRPTISPGSMAALCHAFRADLPRRRTKRGPLSARTLENYRRYADRIEREHGPRLIRQLEPFHCYRIQSALAEDPGVANNYLSVLRLMMAHACKLGWAKSNPAAGIPALALGEHEPWPARVVIAALAEAAPMTRLAIITFLCSGQRIGDVIRMRHDWHDKRIMQMRQSKTGKAVAIPMHPLWITEIKKLPKRATTILYDRSGRPFQSVATLRERINDLLANPAVQVAIAEAVEIGELPADATLNPHGLRKNAACQHSETGLTDEEIGALVGMSPDMVRHYTKRASVYRIADRLFSKVSGATVIPISGPRRKPLAK